MIAKVASVACLVFKIVAIMYRPFSVNAFGTALVFANFDGLVKSDISHKALREHGANLFKILKISLRALRLCAKF